RVAAEAPLKGRPAEENRGRRRLRLLLVVGDEGPAERGVGAEDVEEIRRHERQAQLLRIAVAGERGRRRPDGAEAGEERAAVAQVLELGADSGARGYPDVVMSAQTNTSR